MQEIAEIYMQTLYFTNMGGFNSAAEFTQFVRKYGIEKDLRGWPVYKIMAALNRSRRQRNDENSLSDQLTREKINKERIANAIKLKEFIKRDMAIDRIRTTLIATANKIRYAIKGSAPRVCGLTNVGDIENILTEQYNSAIEQLEFQAEQVVSWEEYGVNIQPSGEGLAQDSQEATSNGSSEKDPSVNEDEHTGEDRPRPDPLPKRTGFINR